MIVRRRRAAAGLLVFCMMFFGCIGCGRKEADSLEEYDLEMADAVQGSEGTDLEKSEDVQTDASREKEDMRGEEADVQAYTTEETGTAESIFVYVCGAVQSPGVYELEAGARVYQAIACAGGVTEDAAEEWVNQARAVSDGEQIFVPTEEEAQQNPGGFPAGSESAVSDAAESTGNAESGIGSAAGGKVNINTASKEELKTLNGIGDTRAERIVSYREINGPFTSIEDLKKVDGIKDGVFQKIKDGITVNAGG